MTPAADNHLKLNSSTRSDGNNSLHSLGPDQNCNIDMVNQVTAAHSTMQGTATTNSTTNSPGTAGSSPIGVLCATASTLPDTSSNGYSHLNISTSLTIEHGYSKLSKRPRYNSYEIPATVDKSEHGDYLKGSPRFLKSKLHEVERKLQVQIQRGKKMRWKIQRLKRKVSSLNQVVNDLKQGKMISEPGLDVLSSSFSGIPLEVMTSICQSKSRNKYTHELRKFALTLYFYSSKAYNYVRSSFQLCLPHLSVINS